MDRTEKREFVAGLAAHVREMIDLLERLKQEYANSVAEVERYAPRHHNRRRLR